MESHSLPSIMNESTSDPPTGELIDKINFLLQDKRSTLPAEEVRLLEEARDELKRARSDPPGERNSSEAVDGAMNCLLRFFAKPEVLELIGEYVDQVVESL